MGRIAISLSGDERSALRALSGRRSEPEATCAARLVRAGLLDEGAALDRAPARRRGPEPGEAERPNREAAIRRLVDRYPGEFAGARDGDRLMVERLSALAFWREELDAIDRLDARGELAFCAELVVVARWAEERGRRRR